MCRKCCFQNHPFMPPICMFGIDCKLRSLSVTPPLLLRTGWVQCCCRRLATSVSGATPPSPTSAPPTATTTSGAAGWGQGRQVRVQRLARGGGVRQERWEGDTGMLMYYLRSREATGWTLSILDLMASLNLSYHCILLQTIATSFCITPSTLLFVFVSMKYTIPNQFLLFSFALSGNTKYKLSFVASSLVKTPGLQCHCHWHDYCTALLLLAFTSWLLYLIF